jgi:hypothetical protein
MSNESMVLLDDSGNPIQEEDDYNELESVLAGGEVPGDDLTGEITSEKDEESEEEEETKTSEEEEPEKEEKEDKIDEAEKEPEKKVDEDVIEEETDDKEATPDTVDAGKDTSVSDLKSQLREQRKQIALMEAKLERMSKVKAKVADAKFDEEEDEDEDGSKSKSPEPEELSTIEQFQNELAAIGEAKNDHFDSLIATMSLNPKFEDVEEVCSPEHLNFLVDEAAQEVVKETGCNLVEAQLAVELHIWKQPNPYAYMYSAIKDRHPDYVKTKEGDKTEKEEKTEEKEDKTKAKVKTKDAPLSALDVSRGGGGKAQGEWTAEKIDNIPEEDIIFGKVKIPDDVYDAYLSGKLDR